MSSVLIISNSADIHTDLLVDACNRQNRECFRFNTDHFRLDGQIVWNLCKSGILKIGLRHCNLSEIGLVVYRRPVQAHRKRNDIEPWLAVMLDNEWDVLEKAISFYVPGRVVNPVGAVALAQNKIIQFKVAEKSGLLCPETLISTDIEQLRAFVAEGACVTKSIGNCVISVNNEVHSGQTRRLEPSDLDYYDPKGCPTLLQRAIKPVAMWRIIVVGRNVYGFRLYGDALDAVADSRTVEADLLGDVVPVPKDVQSGLLQVCSEFSILYASSDFIEDSAGRLWFIDLNPEGQWGAYEQRFGVKISDELIKLCCTGGCVDGI